MESELFHAVGRTDRRDKQIVTISNVANDKKMVSKKSETGHLFRNNGESLVTGGGKVSDVTCTGLLYLLSLKEKLIVWVCEDM